MALILYYPEKRYAHIHLKTNALFGGSGVHDSEYFIGIDYIFLVFFVGSLVIERALTKISSRFDTSTSEVFRLLSNFQKGLLIAVGAVLSLSELGLLLIAVTLLVLSLPLITVAIIHRSKLQSA